MLHDLDSSGEFAATHDNTPLLDDAMWDNFLGFEPSAPVAIPSSDHTASQADSSFDADMASCSPPFGVKIQHFSGDPAVLAQWADDHGVGSCTSPSSGEESIGPTPRATAASVGLTGYESTLKTMWEEAEARLEEQKAAAAASPSELSEPLTWANPTSTLLDMKELPNAGAMELRRQKNRECMRRARQRQREELKKMKATVASLEKQYAELSLQSANTTKIKSERPSPSSVVSTAHKPSSPEYLYTQAVQAAKQLGAENLYLRSSLQEKAAWKLQLRRVIESVPEYAGMALPSPQAPPVRTASLPVAIMDPDEARSVFGYLPLLDTDVTGFIFDNSHQMHLVQAQLAAGLRLGDRHVYSRQVFGWEVIQSVHAGVMEFSFTKKFTSLSVREAAHKTWTNDMELEKFRKVKFDVKRLEVLQEVSPNAYVLGRDVRAPDKKSLFRSVFMRFLIETQQKLPNPLAQGPEDDDTPPLNAKGYILGTHSTNRDWSRPSPTGPTLPGPGPTGLEPDEELVWADLALTIEFLDVKNPATGETYQQIRWAGRTDYKDNADALRNAADTLTGCLRWELLMIAPALNLVSLRLS